MKKLPLIGGGEERSSFRMTTVCELATKLPKIIGGLLDCESKLKRGRFREETLTDIFTGALTAFVGKSLVIQYPPEATTGSDLDIDFWHVSSGDYLGLRVQAKRLNAAWSRGKPIKPEVRSYKELLHRVPKSGDYQFRTLVSSAGIRLPLYMFYNHGSIIRDIHFSGKRPTLCGVNLAFAQDIARRMEAKLLKPKGNHHNKRLEKLHPYFFNLSHIFCPPENSGELVPTPKAVSAVLRKAWEEVSSNLRMLGPRAEITPDFIDRSLLEAPVLSSQEETGFQLSSGPAVRVGQDIQRPVITFISGRTKEIPGPTISDEQQFD